MSSDDVDAILCPNIKVSKVYALFSSIHVFFFELCIFFLLVLELLKFHHAKLHGCKQRRYFVNSL